jgi:hypothetical protein
MGSVARISQISSRSETSIQDAVESGVARASATLRNVSGAWVKSVKAEITDGRVTAWQVIMEVTFVLDD